MGLAAMKTGVLLVYAGVLAQTTQPVAQPWEGVLLQYGALGAIVLWYIFLHLPRQQAREDKRQAADIDERQAERATWEDSIKAVVEEAKLSRLTFEASLERLRTDHRDAMNQAAAKMDEARLKLEECLQRRARP